MKWLARMVTSRLVVLLFTLSSCATPYPSTGRPLHVTPAVPHLFLLIDAPDSDLLCTPALVNDPGKSAWRCLPMGTVRDFLRNWRTVGLRL